MSDNYYILDGNGALQQMAAKEIGGIKFPWHMLSVLVNGSNVPVVGDANGNIGTNVASSALPAGAATSANQSTQISSLAAIQTATGAISDGVWGGSGSGTQIALLKYIATQDLAIKNALTGGLTVTLSGASQVTLAPSATIGLNAGTAVIGKVGMQVGGNDVAVGNPIPVSIPGGATLTGTVSLGAGEQMAGHFGGMQLNPTSILTRPANTTAYAANTLIASNATAGSVAVPTVSCARIAGGSFTIERGLLRSSMGSPLVNVSVRIRLWRAAPTYTNGDTGPYAVATGAAGYLGSLTGVFENFGDGSVAQMQVDFGPEINVALASGQSIWWDLQTLTAFTPTSGATFTFVPEVKQD